TDSGDDYSRRHDEPSRALLVFPGERTGRSGAVVHEDDGISATGPVTTVNIKLAWTDSTIDVVISACGDYRLPYRTMRIVLPAGETRTLELHYEGASGASENRIALFR